MHERFRVSVEKYSVPGFHSKPCGLLNVNDFFTPLDVMLNTAGKEGFMKNSFREVITWSEGPSDLLDRMACCLL